LTRDRHDLQKTSLSNLAGESQAMVSLISAGRGHAVPGAYVIRNARRTSSRCNAFR